MWDGMEEEGTNQGCYHFTLAHEDCHQIYKMLFPKTYADSIAARKIHYLPYIRIAARGDWDDALLYMGFVMYEVHPAGLAPLCSEQRAQAPCAISRLSLPTDPQQRVYVRSNFTTLICLSNYFSVPFWRVQSAAGYLHLRFKCPAFPHGRDISLHKKEEQLCLQRWRQSYSLFSCAKLSR